MSILRGIGVYAKRNRPVGVLDEIGHLAVIWYSTVYFREIGLSLLIDSTGSETIPHPAFGSQSLKCEAFWFGIVPAKKSETGCGGFHILHDR